MIRSTDHGTMDVHVADHIMTITFNRPDLLNRIDAAAHVDLIEVLNSVQARPSVRCIIIASTGSVFSAGGDLNEVRVLHANAAKRHAMFAQGRDLFNTLLNISIPIVVAMQGDAHGMGANIALLCDAIIAPRGARLSDAHVRAGLVAGDGGCVAWPQAAGMLHARRHLLTGDALLAERAFALGLITDLVETPGDVLTAAYRLAGKIAALPPCAVQGTKKALNAVSSARAAEVFELALALELTTMTSDDVLEAADAFLQKRQPAYQGR